SLLSVLLVVSLAGADGLTLEADRDDEMRAMPRPGRRHEVVDRRHADVRLRQLLEAGLRGHPRILARDAGQLRPEDAQHNLARNPHPLIEVDCADDRLEGLREDLAA